MKIILLSDKTAVISGGDPKRIQCEKEGVLSLGTAQIAVTAEPSILPVLINGATGRHNATYTTTDGEVYTLTKVAINGGRVAPLAPSEAEIVELRLRADKAEAERDALRQELEDVRNIFDTNSLNFLIK